MRVLRDEFFIRKDFAFYDSCLASVLSLQLVHVYDLLRRFIFRGKTTDPFMAKLRKEGFLVAKISQAKIGVMMGYKRRQTVTEHIRSLKDIGWLSVETDAKNNNSYYVLGQLLADDKGGKHEVFFADAWMFELWTHLEARAKKEFGDDFEFLDTDPEWRIQVVSEYLGIKVDQQDPPSSPPSEPPSEPPPDPAETTEHPVGCTELRTGGVRLNSGVGNGKTYTEVENSEVEKSEVEKRGARAKLGPPPSADDDVDRWPRKKAKKTKDLSGLPPLLRDAEEITAEDKEELEREADPSDHAVADRRRPTVDPAIIEAAKARQRRAAESKMKKVREREAREAALGGNPVPLSRKKQLQEWEILWKDLMASRFPDIQLAPWGAKERGQVWQVAEKYETKIVTAAITYLVEQWDSIKARMFKNRGGVPSVGFLLRFHDVVAVESQLWSDFKIVKSQYDQWFNENPNEPYPPQELEERFRKIREQVKDLGFQV